MWVWSVPKGDHCQNRAPYFWRALRTSPCPRGHSASPCTPTLAPMATAVATQRLTVVLAGEEHDLTVLSFIDRRGRRPHRRKQWVLVRSIERLLFGVRDGARSTGALVAHLNKCTLGDAVLTCERARVNDNTLKDDELNAGTSHPQPSKLTFLPLSSSRKPSCAQSLLPCAPWLNQKTAIAFAKSVSCPSPSRLQP